MEAPLPTFCDRLLTVQSTNLVRMTGRPSLHQLQLHSSWLKKGVLGPSVLSEAYSAVSYLHIPKNVAIAAAIFHASTAKAGLLATGLHHDFKLAWTCSILS